MFDSFPANATASAQTTFGKAGPDPVALFLGEAGHGRMEHIAREFGLDIVRAETLAHARIILDQATVEVIVMGSLAGGQIDFSACHELSRLRGAPIMVMPDRDDATDRILALELGADDWVPTNCCDRELAARLKVLTRRGMARERDTAQHDEVRFAGWRLNRTTGDLRHQSGATSALSKAELIILKLFLRNLGRVLTRADIQAAVGSTPTHDGRNVVVSVFRLRKKLGAGDVEVIRTVRSVGYVMDGPVQGG